MKFGRNTTDTTRAADKPVTVTSCGVDTHAILQTAVTTIYNEEGTKSCTARLLFDTGASRSFIHERVANKIEVEATGKDLISLSNFGSTSRKTQELDRVTVNVQLLDGTMTKLAGNVVPNICCAVEKRPMQPNPRLTKLVLAEPLATKAERVEIDILVGSDYYYDFIGKERIEMPDGTLLLDSTLGFIPTGKQKMARTQEEVVMTSMATIGEIQSAEFDLRRFWALEQIGIEPDKEKATDEKVHDQFKENIRFVDGRYFVSWPWKEDAESLPTNFNLASGRLQSLLNRIGKTPEVLHEYDRVIQEQLKTGVIERVTEDTEQANQHHYIPHHCVIRPDKATTKIRVVYDASAKPRKDSPSLNESLHRGPVNLPDLCGILLRFRLKPMAISSDVEKAFLQIGLNMPDRDVTRFLWVKDIEKPPACDNIEILRFCRVPFGVISSPFLLAGTLEHHLSQHDSPVAHCIKQNTYVDNVLGGAKSNDEAVEYYTEAKSMFQSASMNLREWSSNDPEFMESLPDKDKSESETVKILGMEWDTKNDTINVAPNSAATNIVRTKRDLLREVSSFYDPMGYFSPIVLSAKILLQEVWKLNLAWDEDLPQQIVKKWEEIATEMSNAAKTKIPRYVPTLPEEEQPELHIFCDASKTGYGTVAYLRTTRSVNLIFSKTRVAPLKEITIPRMELLAALLGSRVAKFLKKELPVDPSTTVLWLDSQCVLGWIKQSQRKLPTFITNQVNEIHTNGEFQFRYIRSKENPADLASRGAMVSDLATGLWWYGPKWLDETNLKDQCNVQESESNNDIVWTAVHLAQGEDSLSTPYPADIDVNNFSDYGKLIRVTAYVLKFIRKLRKERSVVTLTREELNDAETLWIKSDQHKSYQEELEIMKSNRKQNDLVGKLGLFIDNVGLIRCKGRMGNSPQEEERKFPILLSGQSYLARLIILDIHK